MKYSNLITIGLVCIVVMISSLNQTDARMVRESKEEKFLHDIDKLIEKLKSKKIENKIKSVTSITVKLSTPESLKDAIFEDGKLFVNWALLFNHINKKEGYFHDTFKLFSIEKRNNFLKSLNSLKEIVIKSKTSYWTNEMKKQRPILWKKVPKNVQKDLVNILSEAVDKKAKDLTKNDFSQPIKKLGNWSLWELLNKVYSGDVRELKKDLGFQ